MKLKHINSGWYADLDSGMNLSPDHPDVVAWLAAGNSPLPADPISLKQSAQTALDKVTGPSGTIMRCVAAGVAVPAVWSAYVLALRLIANGSDTISTTLPTQPNYPAGT